MTIDFLIEQNNRTLAFLKAQDFTSAVESSAFALKCHKALHSGASQNSLCYSSGNDCLDQCMLLSEMKSSSSHDEASTHQTSFIYDLGIFVPKSVTDPSIVTPILIFNMALAHHLAAEAAGHCALQAWQKARRLYKLAHDSYDSDFNVLFQFVLINNIAMIDRKIGNTAMSTECMEYLLSLWMLLVDHGCNLRLQHVHGFLVNIPSPSETAAAAWRIDCQRENHNKSSKWWREQSTNVVCKLLITTHMIPSIGYHKRWISLFSMRETFCRRPWNGDC